MIFEETFQHQVSIFFGRLQVEARSFYFLKWKYILEFYIVTWISVKIVVFFIGKPMLLEW